MGPQGRECSYTNFPRLSTEGNACIQERNSPHADSRSVAVGSTLLAEKVEVLFPGYHGVDDFFGAVVPDEHDKLQQSRVGIESETKLALRVLVVQGRDEHGGLRSVNGAFRGDAVLER